MTVNELSELNIFKPIVLPDGERTVSGVYIGDLLSWVMANADSGNAWVTIMSNINILAVATLTDVATIIVAEGVTLADDIINTAKEKGINIISSNSSIYDTAVFLSKNI